jgi:hypothetical protein
MSSIVTRPAIAVAAIVLGVFGLSPSARAQYIQVYSAPPAVLAPAPVVSYYAPVTSYYAPPVTSYYVAPPVTAYYAAPVTSYYAPAPAVSYSYYPSTTVYASPAPVATGTITTRSYVGYGIFRPRGVYTQSYYTPGVVYYP